MPLGTSFSPDGNPSVLTSNNGLFAVEFRKWSDSGVNYCMAGVKYSKKSPGAVIWSFNNEQKPVMGSSCTLKLGEDGVLSVQHDANHVVAWQTQTAGLGVQNLTLRDDGNLVLEGRGGQILWQSFDQSPIFLLPSGMNFTKNTTLFQRQQVDAVTDFSIPGSYALQLSQQGRLVLISTSNGSMFVYHSLGVQSSKAEYVVLGDAIEFYDNQTTLIGSIDYNLVKPNSSLMISGFINDDGNLIINYWNGSKNIRSYNSSLSACEMPFKCGEYGLCDGVLNECSCPLGFKQASNGKDCKASDPAYNLFPINVAFHPQLSPFLVKSQDECRTMCAQNSIYNAALFDSSTSSCALFPLLHTIRAGNNTTQVMFLKIPSRQHSMRGTIIGTTVGISLLLCLTCGLLILFVIRRRRRRNTSEHDELFLHDLHRLPPRFSYRDLQVATKDFSAKLGAGGFGTVYEGVLSATGVKVAVKKLDQGSAAQSTDQFRAEVASIGSVSHVNLVSLKGFCMEGASRLLVYEFMARGSLDSWLFGAGKDEGGVVVLDWETRCRIALDTARGLEYLHHQCAERIVHCDVKPENILLDHKFNAKVADFGLAKLIGSDNHSFAMTTLKGTRGYLAPEWLQNATITAKADVYSYGVVLLELITGRRCLDAERGYLPTWALSIATSATTSTSSGGDDVVSIDIPGVEEMLLDELLRGGSVPTSSLERMVMVALGCVQSDPAARPTMASVVQMLDGLVEVAPLLPFSSLHSLCPSPRDGVVEAYALLKSSISPLVPYAQSRSDALTNASSTWLFPHAQAQAR